MPEEIPWETREAAKSLYVMDGRTYEQVAEATGVSVSQLKRWGSSEGWAEEKREYRDDLTSIRRDKVKLRAALLKKALGSQDPQTVYAFASIETIAAREKADQQPQASPGQKTRDIRTPAEAIEALQEVVEIRLNGMLAQPETLNLSQIRDLKQTLELVEQMRTRNADGGKPEKRVLDEASIRRIREQVKL